MNKKSKWADAHLLEGTIRQLAIDNGTPNVMPTIEQMSQYPGLKTWVTKKEGGLNKLSTKFNMPMKPTEVAPSEDSPIARHLIKGSIVFVHNNNSQCPAIVLGKGGNGGLNVLVLNRKMKMKLVTYGKKPKNQFQWCYPEDLPRDKVTISL